MSVEGRVILVTGAGRRIGRFLASRSAECGAKVILHTSGESPGADEEVETIRSHGGQAWAIQADFRDPAQSEGLLGLANEIAPVDVLVNNAAIFEPLDWQNTTLESWQRHLNVNLTAPFLLSQAFARLRMPHHGAIINILDWRALRPADDHLPYTISKAALAALTQSLAVALAPTIRVNGLALGAILPASDGGSTDVVRQVPAKRWAVLEEVFQALTFLVSGPDYITGEILHLDGGRHLI